MQSSIRTKATGRQLNSYGLFMIKAWKTPAMRNQLRAVPVFEDKARLMGKWYKSLPQEERDSLKRTAAKGPSFAMRRTLSEKRKSDRHPRRNFTKLCHKEPAYVKRLQGLSLADRTRKIAVWYRALKPSQVKHLRKPLTTARQRFLKMYLQSASTKNARLTHQQRFGLASRAYSRLGAEHRRKHAKPKA